VTIWLQEYENVNYVLGIKRMIGVKPIPGIENKN